MEHLSGTIKIRNIFLNNGNWWKLFLKHRNLIRIAIITNVLKLIVCRTSFLGYHIYQCLRCGHTLKTPHSCKSRFCPSCGKKATDNWIQKQLETLPKTVWQHITFTLPSQLWEFFWLNRYLFNKIPIIAANIIKDLSNKQGFLPGIFLAIHTFGRDLKRNIHIHLATTLGGLSINDNNQWLAKAFFYHENIKKMWRFSIVNLLRDEFKKGRLKLPPNLKHLKNYATFNSWLNFLYNKNWVVELSKSSNDMKRNVEYLGKYLKRPPIGETRILSFVDNIVTFKFLDHYNNTSSVLSLPALEFIARLIAHIPDKYFRNIRYYGFLSNRLSSKLLPIVYNLLSMKTVLSQENNLQKLSWRELIKSAFHFDPLICPICKELMKLSSKVLPNFNILSFHKEIANGYFQLI